jgi:hypothetical protein
LIKRQRQCKPDIRSKPKATAKPKNGKEKGETSATHSELKQINKIPKLKRDTDDVIGRCRGKHLSHENVREARNALEESHRASLGALGIRELSASYTKESDK